MKMGLPLTQIPQEESVTRVEVKDTSGKVTIDLANGVHWEHELQAMVLFAAHKDGIMGETVFSGNQNDLANFGVQMLKVLQDNGMLPYVLIKFKEEMENE